MSTTEKRALETADATPLRRTAAAQSLVRWYKRELTTTTRAIEIGREHLAAHPGDDGTRDSVRQLEQELRDLNQGWAHSTLRREIEDRAEPVDMFGETRSASCLSSARPGMGSARAGTTSTTKTAVRLEGEAIVYDQLSPVVCGFLEKIARGACTEALKTSDIRLLFNHNVDHLYARTASATLEVRETSHGVSFVAYLIPFDAPSYHLARLIDRGDLSGCSFQFSDIEDRWILQPGQTDIRIIERIGRIYDVGPVTMPWYPTTSVTAVFQDVQRSAPVPVVESDPAADFERWEESQFDLEYDRRHQPPTPEKLRKIGAAYRKAERIINRCARTN